jgi:hypothetical protein
MARTHSDASGRERPSATVLGGSSWLCRPGVPTAAVKAAMSSSTSRRQVCRYVAGFLSGCCGSTLQGVSSHKRYIALHSPQPLCVLAAALCSLLCRLLLHGLGCVTSKSHIGQLTSSAPPCPCTLFLHFSTVRQTMPSTPPWLRNPQATFRLSAVALIIMRWGSHSCTRTSLMSVPHSSLRPSCSWLRGQVVHCLGGLLTPDWKLAGGLSGRALVDFHLVSTITVTCL